jgi:hypothetical protein
MTTLSLTEAPAVLPAETRTRWLSDDHADLKVGDLWLLSWSREALALVVVTKVIDDYVLACPVTLPTDPSFAPAVVRDDTSLGIPLTIWPRAETGLGKHLLRRNLGNLLSETTVRLLRHYAEEGEESPLPLAEGDYYADGNPEYLRELLGFMQALCFHEWPTDAAENAVLAADIIEREHASITFMTDTLGVTVPRARQLLLQQVTPTEAEVASLAEAWDLEPAALLAAPLDDAARTLVEPEFKPLLDQVMEQRGYDEVTARSRSQQEYALAARAAQTGDRRARMRAAIDRVLHSSDGTA